MSYEPQAAIVYDPPRFSRQRISRYLNYAASLLIVFGVAFAGAFMAMQVHQPGDADGRFALFGQQDDAATCDVEPMTVDEVMAIVENPYAIFRFQEGANPPEVAKVRGLSDRDLVEESQLLFDQELIEGQHSVPDVESFTAASARMNEFLGCLQVGNIGQILRFFDPREVQRVILAEYPVYRVEAQIRAGVTGFLDDPAQEFATPYATALVEGGLVYQANPIRESAAAIAYSSSEADRYHASRILLIGTKVTDSEGELLFQNDADGRVRPIGPLKTTDRIRIVMAESSLTGDWIVLGIISE